MLVRPTIDHHTSHPVLHVEGQWPTVTLRLEMIYRGEWEGRELETRVSLQPRDQRERRHAGEGIMIRSDRAKEDKIMAFLGWWPGEWEGVVRKLGRLSSLDFMLEGLPLAEKAGIAIDVDPKLRADLWLDAPVQGAVDLRSGVGGGIQVKATLWAGEHEISPAAIARSAGLTWPKERYWVAVKGKAVRIPDGMNAADVATVINEGLHTATHQDKKPVHQALRLLSGSGVQVAPWLGPVVQAMATTEPDMRPSASLTAELRPYQLEGMRFLTEAMARGMGCILADQPGMGKAQPVGTKVATPSGWRPIGELAVGDFVFGRDGKPTRVTGVFPQGKKQVYRMSFNDDASVLCCGEHLWRVQAPSQKRLGTYNVMATAQLQEAGLKRPNGNNRWYIPMTEAVQYEARDLPVHPYLLGALIANGALSDRSATHHGTDEQREVLERFLPDGLELTGAQPFTRYLSSRQLREAIGDLGLNGSVCETKFIPNEYLLGSIEQRVLLLQGLMDNDGTVSKDGMVSEYNTVSTKLAGQVVELIESLGGVAWVSTRIPTFTYKGEKKNGQMDNRVRMALPEGICPFLVAAKKERFKPRTKYPPTRAIVSIKPEGEDECVCISVEASDKLYLTEHYIVTHNTVQCISAFLKMKEANPGYRMLVIAPKSVVPNWVKELQKFAGHLEVIAWFDSNRAEYKDYLPTSDVIVTSYDILKSDLGILSYKPCDVVVCDEAHVAKNSETVVYKAVKDLPCPVRIMASGTPIENNLEEFHSLMDLACPGLLPPWEQFKEDVVQPYKDGNHEVIERLRALTKPYILRRKKTDVGLELPDKIVHNVLVQLTPRQKTLYDKLAAEAREMATNDEARKAAGKAKGAWYLEYLSKLRMAATDPRLVEEHGGYRDEDSAKLQALILLMGKLEADDGKALVFSQWTRMIDLVRKGLDARGIKYAYLTGQTNNRDVQIDMFQNRPDVRYFLISLKAGGVGLNLTAANTVITCDPWWNPAIEEQAFDRAHRIGQKQTVNVYRLIGHGTVEEQIQTLQRKKADLAGSIIDNEDIPLDSMTQLLDLDR